MATDEKRAIRQISLLGGWIAACGVLLLLGACGSPPPETHSKASPSGSLALALVWDRQGALTPSRAVLASPGEDICSDYQIVNIVATLYAAGSEDAIRTETWSCEDHTGSIQGIDAGSGYRVVIRGLVGYDADEPKWRGEAEGITITAGRAQSAEILMTYVGGDSEPPTVAEISPVANASAVATNSVVSLTFSEMVVAGSISGETLTLAAGDQAMNAAMRYTADAPNGPTIVLTPETDLAPDTTYKATLAAGVQDLAGLAMTTDYTWSFTTSASSDTQAPTVTTRWPSPEQTNAPVSANIRVTFSEPLDPTTLTHDSFYLTDAEHAVIGGGISYHSTQNRAIFIPSSDLANNAEYTMHLTRDITDSAGNPLAAEESWQFATVAANVEYTITAEAASGGGITPAGDVTVLAGSTQSFSITAETGYFLSSLVVDGVEVDPVSPFEFSDVSENHTVAAIFSKVWYVAADATAGGSGTSWQEAFGDLQSAVLAAAVGDEIWVKTGTYLLDNQISVGKVVKIYGGFEGTETYRRQRDWQNQPVVLDGQEAHRCLFISQDAVINGITVRNGAIPGYTDLRGGAAYIDNCSPQWINCTFADNYIRGSGTCQGGAVYVDGGSPLFINCLFTGNYLNCEGGAGGALALEESEAVIKLSRFVQNRSENGLATSGGAITMHQGVVDIIISLFTENVAKGDLAKGGGIQTEGTTLTVSGSYFFGNHSDGGTSSEGGAIYNNGQLNLTNAIFMYNSASPGAVPTRGSGGALTNYASGCEILNCTFGQNSVRGVTFARGGAIANTNSSPTITNTILWNNSAYLADGADGDGFQVYTASDSSVMINYSDIDQEPGFAGEHNLRQDPLLDGQGHLRPGSPCLDQGDDSAAPALDIDIELRPQGSGSDMGADEFIDGDGDQMPDYWETRNGLELGVDDSAADPDGDGLDNLTEYQSDTDPLVTNQVVNAADRGWYDSTGFHNRDDNSTNVGWQDGNTYRAYFTFNLGGVSATVTRAILRLELANYESIRAMERFSIWEVSTAAATLENGPDDVTVYNDLGQGARAYGEMTISPADVGETVAIALSPETVAAINAAAGSTFAVGLRPDSLNMDSTEIYQFSTGNEARTHQLVLITE